MLAPEPAATIGVSLFVLLSASTATVNRWLATVVAGDYLMGHMPWSVPLQEIMTDLVYRHVSILRDPRALLLALLFGNELMPRFLKADFAALTPLQQIECMWTGAPAPSQCLAATLCHGLSFNGGLARTAKLFAGAL
ncbi:MAG: hypothetical protein KDE19_08430 [Caldilineaceae bacterium]|nr:hypothetical protein [Caldilineaceae bacterium]